MKTYDVTIRVAITKTLRVEAETEGKAQERANQEFSVLNDGDDESYEQDTLEVIEIPKELI